MHHEAQTRYSHKRSKQEIKQAERRMNYYKRLNQIERQNYHDYFTDRQHAYKVTLPVPPLQEHDTAHLHDHRFWQLTSLMVLLGVVFDLAYLALFRRRRIKPSKNDK